SFRPRARQVVFARQQANGNAQVMAVSWDGGTPGPLLEADSDLPSASPVDDRIAYLSGSTPATSLPTIWDGRTQGRRPLSPQLTRGRYSRPCFSPDGRHVAIVRGGREL